MARHRGRGAAATEQRNVDRTARAPQPMSLGAAFGSAQRTVGNHAVQRAVAGDLPLQRYAVNLARDATCDQLLAHLAANSPYAPEAAHTAVRLRFNGGAPKVVTKDGEHTVTFPAATVSLTKSVDMPSWNPRGAMAAPWTAARTALRAHEGKHESAAVDAQAAIQKRLRAVTSTGYGTRAEAITDAIAALQPEFDAGLADHDAAQAALDPYEVVIDCP